MVKAGISRGRECSPLPLQPAGRVDEGPVFLRKSRAGKPEDRGLDVLLLIRGNAWRFPEAAGFFRINVADNQPVSFFESINVFLRVRPNGNAVHAETDQAFDLAGI